MMAGRRPRAGDAGIADAFYTVLSAGIVVLAGLAISVVVLNVAGQQGQSVAGSLEGPGGHGLEKGLYAFYYSVDPSADYSSADPNMIPPGSSVIMRPETSLALSSSSLPPGAPSADGMAIWTGCVLIEAAGDYAFRLESADGSWLWLDGTLIADDHGTHSKTAVDSPALPLAAGLHQVKARYFYRDAENAFCQVLMSVNGSWFPPAFYR